MADQLLQQAQDIFEGQIVRLGVPYSPLSLTKLPRILKARSSQSSSPPSSSLSLEYVLPLGILVHNETALISGPLAPSLHHWLRATEYMGHAMDWLGGHGADFLGGRTAVSYLQRESREMVTGEQWHSWSRN